MNEALFLVFHPGLSQTMIDREVSLVSLFVRIFVGILKSPQALLQKKQSFLIWSC
jgi:hypothetical protein